MLYIQPVVHTVDQLRFLLFEDLRIDEEAFSKLNREELCFLCPKYHKVTLTQFHIFLDKERI